MITFLVVVALATIVALAAQRRQVSQLRADRRQRERLMAVLEERLAEARTDIFRYATALDEVGPGVVLFHEDGREILRNRSAREFAGARHADVLVQAAVNEEVSAALRGDTRRRTVELLGPPRRMLVVAATPVPAGGAVVVIDDVSERRRVDSVRRDFVANVSHELKTPVGALGILAEAIVDSDDQGVIRRLADRMTAEAMRVGRLIDDLLALARLETEDAPELQSVRVASIVHDAASRVRGLAESRRVQIDTTEAADDALVLGDAGQLTSAISGLLENACVYSDEGGAVAVRTRRSDTWIDIEVEDHGVGIPTSDLDRIFERFYRVDRARSRNTGGTGLGLAIVRHVATNHGGEVLVTSTEGAGSTFTLRLRSAAIAVAS